MATESVSTLYFDLTAVLDDCESAISSPRSSRMPRSGTGRFRPSGGHNLLVKQGLGVSEFAFYGFGEVAVVDE